MANWSTVLSWLLFVSSHLISLNQAANVALFKPARANATCGLPAEKYYSVLERNKPLRFRTLSTCDASSQSLSHNASRMVDGNLATWWQSPASVDKVFITIDLRGEYQMYYYGNQVVIKFGEYYRPGQLAFYKSSDYGQSYQPWHYFVSTVDECQEKFNVPNSNNPVRVDQVLCMVYPGEAVDHDDKVTLPVVGPRGDINNPSDRLLNWMNVTNVRLHFMSLTRIFDVLAVRWHHYAVREVEIDAFCLCNGQGNGAECVYNETLGDNQCVCQEGACGIDCGTCCPAYNQYPWKPGNKGPLVADPDAACERCNCHNHSEVCVYNETVAQMNRSLDIYGNYAGGGVCQNCQDNTEGINCESCIPFYFRPSGKSQGDRDTCKACNCSIAGTENVTLPGVLYLDCIRDETVVPPRPGMETGDCYCKNNTMGRRCDLCKPGYHNLSAENPEGCQECTCHLPGSVNSSNVCEPGINGLCTCKKNVEGLRCLSCKDTYYDLREDNVDGCTECDCDVGGAYGPVCNKTTGQCECKGDITQRRCDSPQSGYYFPTLHFISSASSDVITSLQNKTWTTSVNIVQGVNASGLFTLILSYTSAFSIIVRISTQSQTAEVTLGNCSQRCYFNLSTLFGELSLSGSVAVNVTYNTFVTQFSLISVVALPQEFYKPVLLRNSTGDDFLANCSVIENDMGVGTLREEFCLAQVFSLTVNYLGRALACNCDETGSVNNTCQKYGGQCHCKPGVTGRMCDKCIAGFYNFTSQGCTECGCAGENKVCDAVTGQCVCPPNTVGRMCDQCNYTFWAWNETAGCQACNCSTIGSRDLQCNLTTGVCSCQPGVQGDKCTDCMDGYKNFSSQGCSPCTCESSGSLSEVCDKSSGQCPCKNNSAGLLCDKCESGFFYLTSSNPEGCTNCVCMGISANCSSTTNYRKQREVGLAFWSLAAAGESQSALELSEISVMDEGAPLNMIAANISTNDTLYWQTASNFTERSLVDAYGGNLSLKMYFKQLPNGTLHSSQPKIIMKGVKNISVEHMLAFVSAEELATRTVLMKESDWVHIGSSSLVSREEFLLVLAKLEALFITASFYSDGQGTYLTSIGDVKIAAVEDVPSGAGRAYDVEQCSCGVRYSGLSCERCARGYHRVNVSTDLYLGKCEPCNCNGHSEDCDAATGQCLNCAHNTTGFNCEICLDGFYGNATDGTPGDCKKCPCESPRTTTPLCVGGPDGRPRCLNCSEGYEGNICGSCMLGFFGEPLIPGGNCSRCQCNNNSDVCNTTTGECVNCMHNTTGFHCERCENGTWGNATQQQCQACTCDGIGAYHNVCNHISGQCECKSYVTGMNCSSCEPYSYNFTSNGCTPCECNAFGSSSLQCNESGICECKNHTLGEKCDLCEWGFFGLPNATCQDCRCNETGAYNFSRCDRASGQCDCKPGVTSRTCDRCSIQHTNFSGNGCDPCPLCSRLGLQADVNATLTVLKQAQDDADTIANLQELWPELMKVEELITAAQKSSAEFDELVKGLLNNITHLKDSELNQTTANLQALLSSASQQGSDLQVLVSQELSRIRELNVNSQAAKDNVTALSATVSAILTQLTSLKNHADSVLAGINGVLQKTYDSEMGQVDAESRNVQAAHNLAMSARYNVTAHQNMSTNLNNTAMGAEGSLLISVAQLDEMRPRIDEIAGLIDDALVLINQTKNLISEARQSTDQAFQLLQIINGLLNSSVQHVSTGENHYQDAESRLVGLRREMSTLDNSLTAVMPELSAANQSVMQNASKHAANLTAEARQRQSVFNTTLSHGARAVDAIKTFEEVVRLGNQSLETSRQVNHSLQEIMNRLENLTMVSSDLRTRVASSRERSEELLSKTLARDTNLPGLRANLSSSNKTFVDAITTGASVDALYSTLQTTRDSLVQVAEVGSSPHSVLSDVQIAGDMSNEAMSRSDAVNDAVPALLNQVNRLEQRMQSINQSAERAAVLTSQAFKNVQNASDSLISVDRTVQRAGELKNITANLQAELRKNMSALEEKLKRAREYVAKIRLALNVQGRTRVQYPPTSRLINKTSYTEISVDFRATRVQGSLFYLSDGSSSGDRSVALTLESGSYVKFQYNLGTGPINIVNWEVRVRPGHWYTAYATRYEKEGRLTVIDHSRNFSRTYEGTTDIIPAFLTTDFEPTDHIYVGGLPDGVFVNKTDRYFDGCIDNVVLNQESLNLWDPVKVEGNRSFCSRRPPDQVDVIPGTTFFGISEGHVKQRMGDFNITGESEMEFVFRTFLKTAFIASVLNGQNYVYGMYLNDSRVTFYFKTSNDTYTVRSNLDSYSDGRWYRVHVVRGLRNASLTVRPVGPSDSGAVDYNMITTSTAVYLPVGQALFFGGKDPNSPINAPVTSSFAGALRWINISSSSSGALMARPLNTANYTESFEGVRFSEVLPMVEQGIRLLGQSYAAVETGQSQMSSISLTFKTSFPSGVLVYSGEGPFFYVVLFHGNLYLVYSLNLTTSFVPVTSSGETLNDGAYHTVRIELGVIGSNVILDGRALTIPSGFPSGPVRLNGTLWIGGVDDSIVMPRLFPVINAFEGGMKDLALNGEAINIFSGRSQAVSLAGVSPELVVVPTDMPTTPPPTLPPPTCGAPYPPLRNGSGEDSARLQGSEYIAFSSSAEVLNYTRERFVISVRFRSLVPNGVLLYVADDVQTPSHFISLELVNGQLVFKHNAGIGTVRVASIYRNYSVGGNEYTVQLLKINQFGAMLVSNKDYSNNRAGEQKSSLVINSPFYYGGVPSGINMSALESNGVGFIGCLGPLSIVNAASETKIFNPRTDRDDRDSSYSYKACYSEIQSQAGFSGDGYIIYDTDYSLPDKTDIKITFRTTTRSGLLLSITNSSGPGSVTLEQLYGQVILIFNGEGNSSVIRWTDPYIPVDGQYNASFHLCDNEFHKVMVRRNFSDVEFQVDDHSAVRGTVPSGFVLQHGTFHIGGVPDGSGFQVHSGMSHKGLTGCVQDLIFDGQSAGIIRGTQLHNVQQGCNAPRVA